MKFIYTGEHLEVSKKINVDLLDFLLEPDYMEINGRRTKIRGCRENIVRYWYLIVETDSINDYREEDKAFIW